MGVNPRRSAAYRTLRPPSERRTIPEVPNTSAPPSNASRNDNLVGAIVRFIPGFFFGAILGFWLVVATNTPIFFFGVILVTAMTGGLLSVRFGLRFWEALRHLRWFPF
jgi:hypothetical protein